MPPLETRDAASSERSDCLRQVEEALRNLRYGEVKVTVQDGVVVQVERIERVRLAGRSRER